MTNPFHMIKYMMDQSPNPYKTICKKQKIVAIDSEWASLKCRPKRIKRKLTSSILGKKARISLDIVKIALKSAIRVISLILLIGLQRKGKVITIFYHKDIRSITK